MYLELSLLRMASIMNVLREEVVVAVTNASSASTHTTSVAARSVLQAVKEDGAKGKVLVYSVSHLKLTHRYIRNHFSVIFRNSLGFWGFATLSTSSNGSEGNAFPGTATGSRRTWK